MKFINIKQKEVQSINIIMTAVVIFLFRVVGIFFGTIRIKCIAENKKFLASSYGFIEMVVFLGATSLAIKHYTVLNIFAYAFGMFCGTYLGLYAKEKYE